MDAGADYLADHSFEFAVVTASAYSRGCGPAWLSCGSGPANYELERGGSAGVRSCLRGGGAAAAEPEADRRRGTREAPPVQLDHLWRGIHGGHVRSPPRQNVGPNAGARRQLDHVGSIQRHRRQGSPHLLQLGEPHLAGLAATVVTALPHKPAVVLACPRPVVGAGAVRRALALDPHPHHGRPGWAGTRRIRPSQPSRPPQPAMPPASGSCGPSGMRPAISGWFEFPGRAFRRFASLCPRAGAGTFAPLSQAVWQWGTAGRAACVQSTSRGGSCDETSCSSHRPRLWPRQCSVVVVGASAVASAGAPQPAGHPHGGPYHVRVLVVTMFSGETQPWLEHQELPVTVHVPGAYSPLRCSTGGL